MSHRIASHRIASHRIASHRLKLTTVATAVIDRRTDLGSRVGAREDADVHYGLAAGKAVERAATLATARARNPERCSTSCDPKILATPDAAWINKPAAQEKEPKLAA
ncbi:hypothetical protein [Cryobacterium sp. TMT2-18-3]|uniref:hypothetical protein n=1 Tax=unclassified Cryobacterium TaxID=2649013 RepID=UPI00351A7E67